MPFFDSSVSVFKIHDSGGAERDLSGYLTEVSGLPGRRALNEVTALGDSGARFVPALESVTVYLSGIYDDTDDAGPDAVLGPLRTHDAPVDFAYGPMGSGQGAVKYGGACWVTAYELTSKVGSQVAFEAVLQVEGAVARAAF